jgi:tetratricopeptide (TPR) repeat protein
MKIYTFIKLIGVSSLVIPLLGCPTPPSAPPIPEPAASAPVSRAKAIDSDNPLQYTTAAERSFAEGLGFYEKGEYAAAIKKFQSAEVSNAWLELHVRALKYLAFSYCVTNNLRACQQAFYDALQLDPQFKLLPSEEGHPIWGPVYQKAKLGPPQPIHKRRHRKPNNSRSE